MAFGRPDFIEVARACTLMSVELLKMRLQTDELENQTKNDVFEIHTHCKECYAAESLRHCLLQGNHHSS